jgi:phage repressor protein C with HTH and peptisase S24 domain
MLDVSDTNIRNYIERGSKPSSDVLEKLAQIIPGINALWLLTGEGEPFLNNQPSDQSTTASVKKNSGVIGSHGTQVNFEVPSTFDDCKQQLAVLTAENEGLRSTVAALETALSAKEEILTLLRGGHNRPN